MKRRNFLTASIAFLGATAFASFLYPVIRFLAPPADAAKDGKVVLGKQDLPLGGAKSIVYNDKPVIVINHPGKGYIALSKVCTHLGCLVEYEKDRNILICPCHAGTFDLEGNVLSGPPPRRLARLPLRVDGDQLVIG